MIFEPPTPTAAFIARWQAKVDRLLIIRASICAGRFAERKERLAHRLLDALLRQRDAITSR